MENRVREVLEHVERSISRNEKELEEESELLINRLKRLDPHTTIMHGHSSQAEKIGKITVKLESLYEQQDQLNYILS